MDIEDFDEETLDISSQEDRDKLLAAAVAHAEAAEAQYRLPVTESQQTGQWKGTLALVVLALATAIALFPPALISGPPPPSLAADALEEGAYASLAIQAEQIHVFQVRNGRLPEGLEELPEALPGVEYVRSNNRVFQLVAPAPDGSHIVFDAARPDPRFERVARMFKQEPGS